MARSRFENDSPKTGTLFLRLIFFGFLELSFFFEKQFLDHAAFYGISDDFEHFPIVLNVLPPDKAFHARLSRSPPALALELDQRGHA